MIVNWGVGRKLAGGFACVGLVAAVLGGLGYWGALQSDKNIREIAQVRLPSVENLLIIKVEGNNIKAAVRTLLEAGVEPGLRKLQYEVIAKSRETYQKAWNTYEPLPQTPEEAELWKQFVPAWDRWRQENNKFLELSKKVDSLDLGDPNELLAQIQKFRADHYMRQAQVSSLLSMGENFQGGEDHATCPFGR